MPLTFTFKGQFKGKVVPAF